MFADISGFTNLSEACAKKGDRGNEELAFCINRYMEGMVTNLDKYGGDIIKFVGDAMIVMWPPVEKSGDVHTDDLNRMEVIRKTIQCSIDIQRSMNNLQIMPGVRLSVKVSSQIVTVITVNLNYIRSGLDLDSVPYCTLVAFLGE